ncbi:MAG: hypothetical protein AAF721_09925 [Myxococcota bacterium]
MKYRSESQAGRVCGHSVHDHDHVRVGRWPRLQAARAFALGLAVGGLGCGHDDAAEDDGAGSDATGADDGAAQDAGETSGSGDGDAMGDSESGAEAARPNWYQDIEPLIATHCRSCHDGSGLAFDMSDYETTRMWAEVMAMQTADRVMPPWHAVETDECTPPHGFQHDARLDDDEVDAFAAWADAGTPLGDESLAPPPVAGTSSELPDPTVTPAMGSGVTIAADGPTLDFFHCLSFDPGNAEEVFIDGFQLVPGNDKVAHHGVFYVDTDAASADWPGGVLQDCGGGPGVGNASMIGGWVPGSLPVQTPDDVGIRLPAGARIVVNMHYHADVLGPQSDDSTALALRYSATVPPWVSEFRLVGAPGAGAATSGEFVIPADTAGHEETLEWNVPDTLPPVRIWAVINHMHKVGVDMRTTIVSGADETCLVQTPDWDYNWQRVYQYDTPVDNAPLLSPGDALRVRCTYDNVVDNPGVAEALGELGLSETRDVVVGDGTLDEMCVAAIGWAVPS